jgi:hypothetical protein
MLRVVGCLPNESGGAGTVGRRRTSLRGGKPRGPAGFGGAARSSYGDLSAARRWLESGARDRRSSPAMPVVVMGRLGGQLPGSSGEDRAPHRSPGAGYGQARPTAPPSHQITARAV